jgi:chromosomal replication initiation ATPase DnaA
MNAPLAPGMSIVLEVAAQFDVQPCDVVARRHPGLIRSRARCMRGHDMLCFRLRTELRWSYHRIGRFCSGRDHTSVRDAALRHAKLIGVELAR